MVVRFLDLKAQYLSIAEEIDGRMHDVILESAFIKGKYVAEFTRQPNAGITADFLQEHGFTVN